MLPKLKQVEEVKVILTKEEKKQKLLGLGKEIMKIETVCYKKTDVSSL